MAQGAILQVKGYTELLRAFTAADRNSRKELRDTLRKVGDVVRVEAVQRISPISAKSAAGYRTRVRQRGVAVQQSLRKTTGVHGEWGSYQMRHGLLPALYVRRANVGLAMEQAMDEMAAKFNRGGLA